MTQDAHAALSHWTPKGWVVNLGAGFFHSWWDKDEVPRSGSDFLLETQARVHAQDYLKVLRAQWISRILGEQAYNDRQHVAGGFWSGMAHYQTVAIAASAVGLGPLGQELAEANEPKEKQKVEQPKLADTDQKIVIGQDGATTIPAVAHSKPSGHFAAMKSFSGGMQLHCTGGFKAEYAVEAPRAGMLGALACTVLCLSPLAAAEFRDTRIAEKQILTPVPPAAPQVAGEIDWPAFMRQHDMTFGKLPANWKQAPHFGNAMVGSMLYAEGGKIRLHLFRADVQDHRDDTYGWAGYSRAHLMIGDFYLETVGKLTGGNWRKDLWNAELTGVIKTDKGEIRIRHYTHAEDMAIVTELTPSAGEQGCRWSWHPASGESTRNDDYPKTKEEIPAFAKKYGDHYAKTLKVYQPNPPGRLEKQGDTSVWIQDFLVGGQYATAWREQVENGKRVQVVSIAHSYPAATAARTAVADVDRFVKLDDTARMKSHRNWWHRYYQQSYVSLPDKSLESLYWQTIYRFGCTSRTGRFYVDCPGIWFQGGRWSYTTTDWNIQCAHWPVYAANRLEQGEELLNRFHQGREELIKAVRPVEWQKDSAYLPIAVVADMIGNRDQDKRYVSLVGNLPWALHNCWWQYRYSMDDDMLREKLYPLLRRSINLYLHMVEESADGKLHLPKTYSPELGSFTDCNFDLALFKWGCHALLHASKRLKIDDALIPRWKEVTERLVDYPANENGFMVGDKVDYPVGYRHLGSFLMIYPLYLVNIDQEGARELIAKSYSRVNVPGKMKLPAMIQSHAAPIAAALGRGDDALAGLKALQGDLFPNGMWFDKPCLESSLGMANIVQNMLIQSWSDPAKDESGPIRIFPALPSAWQDVEFRDLRAEGAFLVSARRERGNTTWVRIKSLAGEPCRIKVDMHNPQVQGSRSHIVKQLTASMFELDLKKNEEVLLMSEKAQ